MSDVSSRRLPKAADPSLILAAVGTVAFYAVVHQPSMRGTVLHHYTTEHIVEYVVVALFIWGIIDVILKLLSFPRELAALRQDWLPHRVTREPAGNAAVILEQVRFRPAWLLHSRIGRRLDLALNYVAERGSAEDHREYLRYLADQDEQATHSNYTLLRFAVGVTPILGLVGTVVHFGTALSGISFDEMAERLPLVVSEMGTAFNTTTIALAAAITMMFCMFVCERIERRIIESIDRLVDCELLNRFEIKDPDVLPFLSSMRSANAEALQMLATTLQGLIGTWSETLAALFLQFDKRQQDESQAWQTALTGLEGRHQTLDTDRTEQFRRSLATLDSQQAAHLVQIHEILERVDSLRNDCAGFVDVLQSIARGEGRLAELQAVLNDNLQSIHQTQNLDEALHVLTAAIHLLTSRHHGFGHHDAAAA